MLDTDTRRRIDTARDILVGKVPDPKSQVEQITIALIYKFMDDMDAAAEELGGKRTFFAGDFARYGWARLMRSGLGGHETLNLYAEGVTRMTENANLPPLFRDIFKNAYLPYRDPETLRSFLKIIDEFTYDHSERLGDAFEYLLSVLGSQGDAGQFRTPRHIIDFMVEIVDPKKDERILDPACGTAGFLISSFKHIRRTNTDADDNITLTPDEKERLAGNFEGYDISPDMVRLSLVNLYLHGFVNPRIHEYDTLTSDDRWGDYADVILANPPFMSPKGGIRPHRRFAIQAKRSEVLFVDYMAEHLTPTGRAGIIVPEGVIFQSQTAYKALRKMLVDSCLVAVVSLPAGVFQPYSGVKTSILILDRGLNRRSDAIAFFRVENDGFGLGAQRREIDANDLPEVKTELCGFLDALRRREPTDGLTFAHGLVVKKEKIAANGEYSLSGERYRENGTMTTDFSFRTIQDIAVEIRAGFACGQSSADATGVPHVRPMNINEDGRFVSEGTKFISEEEFSGREDYSLAAEDVLFNNTNSVDLVGKTCLIQHPIRGGFSNHMTRIRVKRDFCEPHFLALILHDAWRKGMFRSRATRWVGQAGINIMSLSKFEIPLPPLHVQKEIIAEILGYQKVIDGARAVIDNYRPHIPIDPEWPMVELGDICDQIQYGLSKPLNTENVGYKIFRMGELVNGICLDEGSMKCCNVSYEEFEKYRLYRGDILFNRTNSIDHVGRTGIFNLEGDYCFASYLIRLSIIANRADPFFVNAYMNSKSFQTRIKQFASRAIGQANINTKSLASYSIPLPPLDVQRRIVAEIQEEQKLVNANRELVERFETKIQRTIDRVWGEVGSR